MSDTSFTTTDGTQLLLEGVKVQGRVVGRMLDMKMEQRFRNSEDVNVEVVYTFPLPWQAVLLGVEVDLNGKTLKAKVKPKSKARAKYEEAVSEGDSAIMVSVNPDRSYTMELGNLMAHEACVVRLHYFQVLKPENGSLRLMLPTTLAPRYGSAVRDARYEPHAVPEVSATVEYPFDIRLDIEGELVHAKIGSPSHLVSIRTLPTVGIKPSFTTQVQLGSKAWLDRDFVLVFDELNHESIGLAAWDRMDAGLGVVMCSFTPKPSTDQNLPVTMKVLVDCSGSMAGDSIDAARNALQAILSSLRQGDRFSLSRFGNHVEHRTKALWKFATPSVAAAQRWAARLQADMGGTEMNAAILSTLALPGSLKNDVLLITDGEIHAIDEVVEAAVQSGHRFFVVGIGSSVAEGLLRRLAHETGGSCEFVLAGEHVQSAVGRLYRRMRSPKVLDARVAWPTPDEVHTSSVLPKSIFGGDDVTVFARVKANRAETLTGNVKLFARVEGVEQEVCIAELTPAFIADEENTLARLAANHRYSQLMHGEEDAPAVLKKQLPALAEKYQLVTEDTSLILVQERHDDEKAVEMPALRTVRSMFAAGHAGHGTVTGSLACKGTGRAFDFDAADMPPLLWRTSPASANSSRGLSVQSPMRSSVKRQKADDGSLQSFLDSFDGVSRPQERAEPEWTDPPFSNEFWAVELEGPEGGFKKYEGLTPSGLAYALRLNSTDVWPTTYADLEKMGLGSVVVDWLELCIGARGYDQPIVVHAFLETVKRMAFTLGQTLASAFDKLTARTASSTSPEELNELLVRALAQATARDWPEPILDFAEATNVSS